MTKELFLAAFLIGVGLCLSGAGTHLYQMIAKQPAMLRYANPKKFLELQMMSRG